MRGILPVSSTRTSIRRFNPAYAGNMSACQVCQLPEQVQPRVCGEYYNKFHVYTPFPGSTPRMRGISAAVHREETDNRFNPAYAGNIDCSTYAIHIFQVQPRVCGEYSTMKIPSGSVLGSTPRMRGIYLIAEVLKLRNRFNPARAGNIP